MRNTNNFFKITFLLFSIFLSLGEQDPGSFEIFASLRGRRFNTKVKTLKQDYHYPPNYRSMRLTGNIRRRERLFLTIKPIKM